MKCVFILRRRGYKRYGGKGRETYEGLKRGRSKGTIVGEAGRRERMLSPNLDLRLEGVGRSSRRGTEGRNSAKNVPTGTTSVSSGSLSDPSELLASFSFSAVGEN